MDLNWLQDFVCLARTLNFTRAADERGVTQSAFSRRIKALEIWIGAPLIDRTSYPVRLSSAGELFLPVAKQLALQLLQARDEVRSHDSGGRRFHAFAAPHSISIHHLAGYLRALERAHGSVRTRVMSDNLHACCQLLAEGACDFLMCYRHRRVPLALDEARFVRLDLGTERLVPVAAAGRADGWRLPGRPRAPIPALAYARGSFLGAVVDTVLGGRRAALDIRHMDAFAEALKSLALQGTGVCWLPESSIAEELRDGRLAAAGDDDWSARLTLSIFTDSERLEGAAKRIWAFFAESAASGRRPSRIFAQPRP